jgi:hypothetical protein
LGFLVTDEAFDEWEEGKNKWIAGWNKGTPGKDGYHHYFKEWADTDLRDMILRNYNHPSVILWSIGNEIDYPNDPYSAAVLSQGSNPQIFGRGYMPDHPAAERLGALSARLVQAVKKYDTTRPVTAALAGVVMSNTTNYPGNLDITGYNYQEYRYAEDHQKYPDRIIYGSENGMQLGAWLAVDTNTFISGQYLWTGIDYLGEAGQWPNRSNTAGLLNLGGFPKPEYYFRQSLWAQQPMIYIGTANIPKTEDRGIWSHKQAAPVWQRRQGELVRVNCFTNCTEAELLLNGQSLGRKKRADAKNLVIYWDLAYQPGELVVVGYNNGKPAAQYALHTPGAVAMIQATVYNDPLIPSTGLKQIEITLTDSNGNRVYNASNTVAVSIKGNAKLLGLENSDSHDVEGYHSGTVRALNGQLIAYVLPGKEESSFEVQI